MTVAGYNGFNIIDPTTGQPANVSGGSLQVGGRFASIQSTPTITASSAYAAGQNVGGLQTLANVAQIAGGSITLQSITVFDKDKQNAPLTITLFAANPSNSTFTDKTAQAVVAADNATVVGTFNLTSYTSYSATSFGGVYNLGHSIKIPASTSMYAVAQNTSGTPTYTTTSSLLFTFNFIQE